jgi:hypothetical protein
LPLRLVPFRRQVFIKSEATVDQKSKRSHNYRVVMKQGDNGPRSLSCRASWI